jgi:glycosyltransferase involved in cell wall biosynthesis
VSEQVAAAVKVLLVYPSYPPLPRGREESGADYVQRLAESLAEAGIVVHVLTSCAPGLDSAETHPEAPGGPTIHRVVSEWGWRNLLGGNRANLCGLLQELSPDVIHVITPVPALGARYLLPSFLRLLCPRAAVTTSVFNIVHRTSAWNPFFLLGNLILYLSSRKLFFEDEGVMRRFGRCFPFLRSRCVFIPCGNLIAASASYTEVDRAALRRKHNLDPEAFYIAFFGFWYKSKNVDALVNAAARLKGKGFPVKLLLVGGDPDSRLRAPSAQRYVRRVKALISGLGLSEETVVTGYCEESVVAELLFCADTCVLPFSRQMVGRSSLVTALVLGLPVITTRCLDCSLLQHGVNAYLADWRSSSDLAGAIEEVLRDPGLRRRLALGAAAAGRNLTWARLAGQWADVFREIRSQTDGARAEAGSFPDRAGPCEDVANGGACRKGLTARRTKAAAQPRS